MIVNVTVVLPSLVSAQADFSLNLLRNSGTVSTLLSPISISIALAMVYLGAKDKTANQIRNAIAGNATEEAIHAHFASVLDLIDSNSLNVTLESANKVYVNKDFQLLRSYIDGIKKHYKGQIQSVDFSDAEKTAHTINSFVENATHDRIKDLVKSTDLDSLTRLMLLNAVYFKGTWQTKFNANHTKEAKFHKTINTTSSPVVQMMSVASEFLYDETNDYQVLQLPYTGKKIIMYVFLPRKLDGLNDLITNLNGEKLAQLLSKEMPSQYVNVSLPKFKINYDQKLNDALQKIGITEAFNDAKADLSGITGSKDLSISDVVHKTFIDVNEEGSEAAAATEASSDLRTGPSYLDFIADHPFLFVIAENNNSSSQPNILFVGKYFN